MYADADGYYEIHPNGEDGDAVTVYCDLTLGADYYICDDCNDFWRYTPTEWASTNALSYSFDWHPSVGYCEGGDWRELAVGSLEECWEVCAPSAAGSSYSYSSSHSFSYSYTYLKECFEVENAYCQEYDESYHNMEGGGMTESYSTAQECMEGCYNRADCARGYFYAPGQYCYFFGIDGYADTCTWGDCGDDCTGFECDPSSGDFHYGGNYYTYDSGGDNFATACVNWMPEEERCSCMGEWSDDDSEIDASDYCVQSDDPRWGVAVPRGTEFSRDCENDGDSYEHDCPSGMEPIIPRSREHWVRSVCHWFLDVIILRP